MMTYFKVRAEENAFALARARVHARNGPPKKIGVAVIWIHSNVITKSCKVDGEL
jgi:hypothetical protein